MKDDIDPEQYAAWLAQLDLERTRERILAYAAEQRKKEEKFHKLEKKPASVDTFVSKVAEGGASLSQMLLAFTGGGAVLSIAIGRGKNMLAAIRRRREDQISKSARKREETHAKKASRFEKEAGQKVSGGGAHGKGGVSLAFLDAMKKDNTPIDVLGLPLIPGSVSPYLRILKIAGGVIVAAFAISLFAAIMKKVM